MSFEITDLEAEEVYFTIRKKVEAIEKVFEREKTGFKVTGKEALLYRLPIMQEILSRLKAFNPKFGERKYPNLEV